MTADSLSARPIRETPLREGQGLGGDRGAGGGVVPVGLPGVPSLLFGTEGPVPFDDYSLAAEVEGKYPVVAYHGLYPLFERFVFGIEPGDVEVVGESCRSQYRLHHARLPLVVESLGPALVDEQVVGPVSHQGQPVVAAQSGVEARRGGLQEFIDPFGGVGAVAQVLVQGFGFPDDLSFGIFARCNLPRLQLNTGSAPHVDTRPVAKEAVVAAKADATFALVAQQDFVSALGRDNVQPVVVGLGADGR